MPLHEHHSERLIEVTRGELTESVHRGHIAVVDTAGTLIASAGDPAYYTYARSAAKLLQAIPLVESGGAGQLGLTESETALCCASHGGEPGHTEAAKSMLAKAGCDESALRCGTQEPMFAPAADMLKAGGQPATALHNNCSGKHAGMLALAKVMNVSIDQYTDPQHPVQQKMLATVADMCGVPQNSITLGTDGCGVPVFAVPVSALAYAYARLGSPEGLPPQRAEACRRIVESIRHEPYYVAGTARFDTALVKATGGRIIGKFGAEGVYAASVPELGIGLALKIEDGAERAIYPAAAEALLQLGFLRPEEAERLTAFHRPAVLNRRGDTVGRIRPVFTLTRH
ncbi:MULTISPECIES: asparaginase [Paenibacillus]|uniref:asparaginase n=1 Tax=Paenibacillus TaxID=44249 RepID=UPI0022B91A32|nr:asparaginase [Paenibacillus caseinilyticus]MCZ8520220.1 asparaginase [Paenibacillus caseinilyticus]